MPTPYRPTCLFLLFTYSLFIPACLDSSDGSSQLCMAPRRCTTRCDHILLEGAPDARVVPFEERLRAVPADVLANLKSTPLEPTSPFLRPWAYIVLHHSATARGGAVSFDKMHRAKGWDGLGYHFVIGNGTESKDGEIEVGFRWREQREGAHAGNTIYNQLGIGICLVGNFETTPPTKKQLAALNNLLGFLTTLCAIPPMAITMHRIVREDETICPGRHFPFSQVVETLQRSIPQLDYDSLENVLHSGVERMQHCRERRQFYPVRFSTNALLQ